jgi:hypothetical protein
MQLGDGAQALVKITASDHVVASFYCGAPDALLEVLLPVTFGDESLHIWT